jgi:tRNA A-37 threonylcarbamoyl transferase component Bud32
MLSPEGLTALLRLLASSTHVRISSSVIEGRTVWVKRYDVEATPIAKRIHHVLSPLLPRYLRASVKVDGSGFIDREIRKMEAFRAAGFPVADIVFSNEKVLVLSDVAVVGERALAKLRYVDSRAHDDLLVGAAEALGLLHKAGLCHGRPHPRDMFVRDGAWGFIDFEEEPETAMPLATAQARDLWLLFLQISGQALLPYTETRALEAYSSHAPQAVFPRLRTIVRFFSRFIVPLRMIKRIALGNDGRRVLDATVFLQSALAATNKPSPSAHVTGRDRPKG